MQLPLQITWHKIEKSPAIEADIRAKAEKLKADLDGTWRVFLDVLIGKTTAHRKAVFGTHTGNDNGGPGIANHCPARTIRTATHRYIVNLAPDTKFTTHITGCTTGPHHLPDWGSWIEAAETSDDARRIVHAYQHRPREELFDVKQDPHEMDNLAGNAEHAAELAILRRQLANWCRQQGDPVAANALRDLSAYAPIEDLSLPRPQNPGLDDEEFAAIAATVSPALAPRSTRTCASRTAPVAC